MRNVLVRFRQGPLGTAAKQTAYFRYASPLPADGSLFLTKWEPKEIAIAGTLVALPVGREIDIRCPDSSVFRFVVPAGTGELALSDLILGSAPVSPPVLDLIDSLIAGHNEDPEAHGGLGGGVAEVDLLYVPAADNGTIQNSAGDDAVIPCASSEAAGLMSPGEKAKLANIAPNATANLADAQLLDRANHQGTQPASSISDLTPTVSSIAGGLIDAHEVDAAAHPMSAIVGLISALAGKQDFNAQDQAKLALIRNDSANGRLGVSSNSATANFIAYFGHLSNVTGDQGTAFGYNARAGGFSLALGISSGAANTFGSQCVAVGPYASAQGSGAISIGMSSAANGLGNVAIGVACNYDSQPHTLIFHCDNSSASFGNSDLGAVTGNISKMRFGARTSFTQRFIGGLNWGWADSTDASRRGQVQIVVSDAAGDRSILRGDTSGTEARIGLLGAQPIARRSLPPNASDLSSAIDLLNAVAQLLKDLGPAQ